MKRIAFTNLNTTIASAVLLFVGFSVFAGCQPASHDGHAEKSFSEVVTDLVATRNKVRDAFAAGQRDAAHEPLHEVGHQLEDLAAAAGKAELSADEMTSVKEAKETLFDAFGAIDEAFHGKEGKTYDDVAEEIGSAMQVLTSLSGVEDTAAPAGSTVKDDLPTSDAPVVEGDGSGDKAATATAGSDNNN